MRVWRLSSYYGCATAMCVVTNIVVVTTAFHVVSALLQVCPTPQPCHCTGIATSRDVLADDDDEDAEPAVVCSFLRLRTVPYFLTFDADVWTELDLSQNLLETIPAEAFHGVRVRRLRLDRNDIRLVDDEAFRGVGPEVEMVDMSHNRLLELRLGVVFRHLTRLRVLRMRYNSLVNIDSQTTAAAGNVLPSVLELDLTGNEFDHVPSTSLSSLPALRRLILRNNRLSYIGSSAFAASAFLELVDVGANRFSRRADGGPLTIDNRAFCGLEPRALSRAPGMTDWTGLQQVRLDHNALTHPQLCSLTGVWTLVDIDLSGNPLRCDCALLAALRRMTETAVGLRVNHAAQCASPDRLAGQTVTEALRQWQPTSCSDAGVLQTCDIAPCAVPLSLASSSSSTTGSSVTSCVCAAALACAVVRIVARTQLQSKPRRIRACRTTSRCLKSARN